MPTGYWWRRWRRPDTAIDWCLCSTGIHNCRTRHGRGLTRELLQRSHADNPAMWGEAAESTIFPIGDVGERYNAQDEDLLDSVIAAGHARSLRVYGNVRLNHAYVPHWLEGIPGTSHAGGLRKDFRDDTFQAYLLELFVCCTDRMRNGACPRTGRPARGGWPTASWTPSAASASSGSTWIARPATWSLAVQPPPPWP